MTLWLLFFLSITEIKRNVVSFGCRQQFCVLKSGCQLSINGDSDKSEQPFSCSHILQSNYLSLSFCAPSYYRLSSCKGTVGWNRKFSPKWHFWSVQDVSLPMQNCQWAGQRKSVSFNPQIWNQMIQLLRSFLESTRTGEFIFKSWNNLCLQLLMIEAVGS